MKKIVCFLVFVLGLTALNAQRVIPLYRGTIQNSKPYKTPEVMRPDSSVSKVSVPTLTVFLPPVDKANGIAVIICPGGGYGGLVMKREGYEVARELNKTGIAGIVLKYRMPADSSMVDKSTGPLQDAQQAIKTVRENAAKWNIHPDKIGIMGFSAGGHLASTAGTHFNKSFIDNHENTNLRPDFMVLVYPVISLSQFGHAGSAKNLLGESPKEERINYFSNELQVTAGTPPAFLIHGNDDSKVPVENSILFYEALRKNKVRTGIHLFATGEHGFPAGEAKAMFLRYCIDWISAKSWNTENK